MDINNLKIAVVGVGGVGGYLAAHLAKTFPHVTVVARGKRGETIREQGLVLHSEYKGEIVAHPEKVAPSIQELDHPDVIFVCVKNYSLEEACRDLKDHVDQHTILIPVMNGVDPGDRVKEMLPECTVVKSLIYIVAFSNEDYSTTQQGNFARIRIGGYSAKEKEAANLVSDLFAAADLDHKTSDDIELEIWRKYILNCAYNVATAAYQNTIGQLRDDSEKTEEYYALVREAYAVGEKKGVALKPEHAEEIIKAFPTYQYQASSSLQRDIAAGRPAEIETFSGYIVKEGQKLGLDIPVSQKMYEMLLDL